VVTVKGTIAVVGLACSNRSMDLGAIGPGLGATTLSRVTGSNPPAALAPVAAEFAELGDSVTTLLQDLSAPDIAKLIDLLERPLPTQDTAQLQDLLPIIVSTAAEGDAPRALSALSEIVALDPSCLDILRRDPAIAPIHASIDQFPDRRTTLARLDAEGRLEQAAHEAGSSGTDRLTGWDMRPVTMVLLANRIFDSGGLTNYVRAAELAQVVIDGSQWAPGAVSLPARAPGPARIKSLDAARRPSQAVRRRSGRTSARLRPLWLRAPLLILLLVWLLLGIAGGCGSVLWHRFRPDAWPGSLVEMAFQAWGIGFLVLVIIGFLARVRKARRPW
jgi:hypothetical protein